MSINRKELNIRFVFDRRHPFAIVQPMIYLNTFMPPFFKMKSIDFNHCSTVVDASDNKCHRNNLFRITGTWCSEYTVRVTSTHEKLVLSLL